MNVYIYGSTISYWTILFNLKKTIIFYFPCEVKILETFFDMSKYVYTCILIISSEKESERYNEVNGKSFQSNNK